LLAETVAAVHTLFLLPELPFPPSHYKHRLFPLSLVTCRRFASFPLPRHFRGERSVQAPRRADIRGVSSHPPLFSQGGVQGPFPCHRESLFPNVHLLNVRGRRTPANR
jgi:hypothetical protein